jgi:transposase
LTARLEEYIAKQATFHTFTAVASETGRSEKNVRTIFKAHAARVISSRNPEAPRCLGMDDVYVDRKARCVLVDNYRKRLYELLPQVNKPPLFRFLLQIPGRKDIEVVTMDMWSPFRDAARDALPDASIVVDRFHIQRPLNNAPKKVARDLKPRGKSGERFSRDPYLLISSSARLNDDEIAKRDIWFNSEPLVRQAYGIKESILNIWNILDRCEAAATYDRLVSEIPPSLQGAFKEFTTSMTNWRHEIFNYWDYPWTNAYAESTNSIIKGIQRAGKSLDFTTVREKALCRDLLRGDDPKQHRRVNHAPAARAGRTGCSSANHPHGAQNYQSPRFNTNFPNPEGRSEEDSDR